MSEYKEFLQEKEKIDSLLDQGFQIVGVIENVSGAFVTFEKGDDGEKEVRQIQIKMAEARKYFSTLLWIKKAT
ncbi:MULTISPECIES: hypothetical protein [Bacillaceae]|uniref:hypothetical protein n=1 Tax=Bacillaceae TaxID=186817 RepID=UPI000BFB22D8|nr:MULTISPECIES: hypothetical protein [Bacillaceae]PGT87735.1 hypothetical protein COD11_06680 [Bacillus sp. AFS040349]UGB32148.1 hypothetical protein LPC09_06700 [Metabacillus sp. B2-18]